LTCPHFPDCAAAKRTEMFFKDFHPGLGQTTQGGMGSH